MLKLPDGFILGGATAAYQCEGATQVDGKGRVPWDDYLEKDGRFSPNPACDFYHKYPEDLELCRKFGIKAIRISIAWSRIFPNGYGKKEQRGVDYYHKLFDKCIENGVEPYVTLHHFDSPDALYHKGDWLNRENIDHFVDYADFCFKEFGSQVKKWITINEPTSVAVQQFVTGTFPPQERFNFSKAFQCEHHFNLAHARVVNLFKDKKYEGEIGVVHALQTVYPLTKSPEDRHAADLQDALEIRFFLDGTLTGTYSDETMALVNEILEKNNAEVSITKADLEELRAAADRIDFVGVNYYFSKFLKAYDGPSEIFHNGTGKKGTSVNRLKGIGEVVTRDDIPTTDWDWPIYPKGMYDMLMRIKHDYPKVKKIYVTENGLGYKDKFVSKDQVIDDQPRIDYIKLHLEKIAEAIQDGANVQGYFVWSLQDMFSWTNGYNKRYGLFYVDFETQERYPKKSAYWFKKLSEQLRDKQ
ncbi:MAG: lacG [Sporolactobacillus laevolacticus]|jgi:6-phospho-beta-galactosidase|nr:lacG [Sporolactobacillus laevolacticus]